ncbi:MAG: HAMP domain-containing histidine kinase [Clostridia bacterium]|nr:HAMP domain-containing histidine kinase [Clostridia bacterium]
MTLKQNKKIHEQDLTKRLRWIFVISFISVLLFIVLVTLVGLYFFLNSDAITYEDIISDGFWKIAAFIIAGVLVGTIITAGISRLVLKPSWELLSGVRRLAQGDFSARMDLGGAYEMKELASNFNDLAQELENTEILRSDFINNFSHEFKTPIVSVKGLVELLKKSSLPEEKRVEYLHIIEEELDRVSDMATNILNLSKIENQTILTDVTEFNLSEQIRTCILLLEKKWSKKDIEFKLDFKEYRCRGNEDMLKQVWLNLLDNAIKFSFDKSTISVDIEETDDSISVKIADSGETIPEEEFGNIFNKFYQKDKTAQREGNGIGLSIVSHIIKLHQGTVGVESANDVTTFTVTLKKDL